MAIIGKFMNPGARPRATRRKDSSHPYEAVAEMAGSLRHSQDIPIRIQREWLAMFLVVVAVLGLVAGLYLNVTARAAIAGREIQTLDMQIAANQRINADLQIQIAIRLSNAVLYQRALAMGFEPVARENLHYMVVPGYFPPQGVNMVSPVAETDLRANLPEYSESLFDWIGRQIEAASRPLN
jgi:hypothetical protein